jgi:hypothetical protein
MQGRKKARMRHTTQLESAQAEAWGKKPAGDNVEVQVLEPQQNISQAGRVKQNRRAEIANRRNRQK